MAENYSHTDSMREAMAQWLSRDEPSLDQLVEWLQGHDLPPAGHDLDPYQWVMRGLPLGPDRHASEQNLARAVARFLVTTPEEGLTSERTSEVLFNALMLSAALGPQADLSAALREMLRGEKLSGEWRGLDLRKCLLDALVENQLDRKLEPLWSEMLDSQVPPERFLQGSPFDGFQGVVSMPNSDTQLDQPALDAIGGALRAMAELFEGRPNRRHRFREVVRHVVQTHRQRPTWDLDLILQASSRRWPLWAVETLPSLYVPLQMLPNGRRSILAWKYLLYPLPNQDFEVVTQFSNGILKVIEASAGDARLIEEIGAILEAVRIEHTDPSDRSLRAEIALEMDQQALEMHGLGRHELGISFKKAADRVYEELGVGRAASVAA